MIKTDFIKLYESLNTLNESINYDEKNILSDQELKELKDKLAIVEPELKRLKEISAKKRDIVVSKFGRFNWDRSTPEFQEYQEAYDAWLKLYKEVSPLQSKLFKHEETLRYKNAGEGLATEEDWEEILYTWDDIEVEGLEVEVEEDEDEYPSGWNPRTDSIIWTRVPAKRGVISRWTTSVDVTKEHVAEYLKKKVEEITTRDLMELDESDFATYLSELDEVIAKAEKEAAEDYEYDNVDWYDDSDYEPDYY